MIGLGWAFMLTVAALVVGAVMGWMVCCEEKVGPLHGELGAAKDLAETRRIEIVNLKEDVSRLQNKNEHLEFKLDNREKIYDEIQKRLDVIAKLASTGIRK